MGPSCNLLIWATYTSLAYPTAEGWHMLYPTYTPIRFYPLESCAMQAATCCLRAKKVDVLMNGTVQCSGNQSTDGLWRIPLQTGIAGNLIGVAGAASLVTFAHAALFSPALSTLITALERGHIQGMPGLNVQNVRRHPSQLTAMHKGHLDQTQKINKAQNQNMPMQPMSIQIATTPMYKHTHTLCHYVQPQNKIYTDQIRQ